MTTSIGNAAGYIRLDASSVLAGAQEARSALQGLQGYVQGTFANLGGSMQQWGGQMTQAGLALSGLMAPITALGVDGVRNAMAFEDSMAEIQARTGLTVEGMEAVRAKALEMGAQTNYSAGDASRAMLQLLSSGQSVEEMMQTLPVVLTAAAASGEDLGMTADAVTDIMAQFHLPVSEATNVVNALSRAAGASSADITSLMQGFGNVGGLASQFGLSVDEVSAILAIFSENGIKGAEAGTQLKSMLTALTTSEDASGALAKLNVSLTDSEGNFRNMNDILGDLRTALYETSTVTVRVNNMTAEQSTLVDTAQRSYARAAQNVMEYQNGLKGVGLSQDDLNKKIAENQTVMNNAQVAIASATGSEEEAQYVTRELNRTQAERFEIIKELAGSYGQLGMTALLTTEGGLTPMLELMLQQTEASAVAEARMNTFSGSIEYVRGSLETLQITVMTPFIQNVLKPMALMVGSVINKLNEWAVANPELASTIVMLLAGLSGLGGVLMSVGAAMVAVGMLLPYIGLGLAVLLGPVGLTVAALIALVAIFEPLQVLVEGFGRGLLGTIEDLFKGANLFEAVGANFANFAYLVARAFGMSWREATAFKENFTTFVSDVEDIWNRLIAGDWGNLAYLLGRMFGMSWEEANTFRDNVLGWATDLEATFNGFMAAIQPLISSILAPLVNAWQTVREHSLGAGNALQSVGLMIVGWLFPPLGMLITLVNVLKTAFETNFLGIRTAVEPVLNTLRPLWTVAADGLGKLAGTVKTLFDAFKGGGGGGNPLGALLGGLSSIQPSDVTGMIGGVFEAIGNAIANIGDFLAPYIPQFIQGFNRLWESLEANGPAIAANLGQQFGALLTEAFSFIFTYIVPAVAAIAVGIGGLLIQYGPDVLMGLVGMMDWVFGTAIPELLQMATVLGLSFLLGFISSFDADMLLGQLLNLLNGALAALIPLAQQLLGQVLLALLGVLAGVLDTFTNIKNDVSTKMGEVKTALETAWDDAKTAVQTKLGDIWDSVKTMFDNVKNDVTTKMFEIGLTLAGAWEDAKTAVQDKLTGIWDGVKAMFDNVKNDVINKMLEVGLTLAGAWEDAKTAVQTKFDDMVTAARTLFDTIKVAVVNKMFEIGLTLAAAWQDAKTAVQGKLTEIVTDVGNKLTDIKTKVTDAATGIKDEAVKVGEALMNGIMDGINNLLGDVEGLIASLAELVPGWLKEAWEIFSPSRVMMGISENLMQGLMIPLENTDDVAQVANNLAGAVTDPLANATVPTGAGGATASNTYHLNIQMPADLMGMNIQTARDTGERFGEGFLQAVREKGLVLT